MATSALIRQEGVYEGKVVDNTAPLGLIKPLTDLPPDLPQGNVSYSTQLASIKIGTKVEFILDNTQKTELNACLLWQCEDSSAESMEENRIKGERIPGRIIERHEEEGFIRPNQRLPVGFLNTDVRFSTTLADVDEGDLVEFTLKDEMKAIPTANKIWFISDATEDEENVHPSHATGAAWDTGGLGEQSDMGETFTGTVIDNEGPSGLIQPLTDLPTGYKSGNVSYPTSLCNFAFEVGRRVEFILDRNPSDVKAIMLWYSEENEPKAELNRDKEEGKICNKVIKEREKNSIMKPEQEHPTENLKQREKLSKAALKSTLRPTSKSGSSVKSKILENNKKSDVPSDNAQEMFSDLNGKRLEGVIKGFHKDSYGFIDHECFPGGLYFNKSTLRSSSVKVVKGDQVSFIASVNKGKDGWHAYNVKVIEYNPRSPELVEDAIDYVHTVIDTSHKDGLIEIMNSHALWHMLCNTPEMTQDMLRHILIALLALEEKSVTTRENFRSVLELVTRSKLCNVKSGPIKAFLENHWKDGETELEKLIQDFFILVVGNLPQKAKMITDICKYMLPPGDTTYQRFFYNLLCKVTQNQTSDVDDLQWDQLPLVPVQKELQEGFQILDNLSPVKRCGAYNSPVEYMDIYFRLLRVDCFRALCSGIKDHLENKLDPRDMRIYRNIKVMGINISGYNGNLALAIQVIPERPIENWSTCSNLKFGNLLCLSPSGSFEDPIWAMVKERNVISLKANNMIWIELCSDSNEMDDTTCIARLHAANGRTVLAESPTYYTAYQPVLRALQKMNPDDLPFKEEIIYVGQSRPSECLKDVQNKPAPASMDESQIEAFNQAMKQRVSIIQGPPGTGKTYIGIKIVQRILESDEPGVLPILVLTFKNHALDEFLKSVLPFAPDGVARVGGRSSDPELAHLNINTLKRNFPRSSEIFRLLQDQRLEADDMKMGLEKKLATLEESWYLSTLTILHSFTAYQLENLIFGNQRRIQVTLERRRCSIKIADVWDMNKHVICDEELSPTQKLAQLDRDILTWIQCALDMWIPQPHVYKDIMTNEERLSSLFGQQSGPTKKLAKKVKDEENAKDDEDIDDEVKERKSDVWQNEKPLEMTVQFRTKKKKGKNMPQLIPSAKCLASEVSLASIREMYNPWDLPPYDRAVVIQVILWHYRQNIEKDLTAKYDDLKKLQTSIQELENERKVSILSKMKVVGMTITGASIYQQLLESLKPAVVLVEEAAEVLEARLIAVLGKWVKQLVLIGDHKQLRPQVDTHDLVKYYNFDISMMERLIENGYPYKTLQTQNRMRPEMAVLLHDIYPGLKSNMKLVAKNDAPEFVSSSVYFWSHDDLEGVNNMDVESSEVIKEAAQDLAQGRSFVNIPEAARAINLACLFIQQGYEPGSITILGAYQGQVMLLRSLYRKMRIKLFGETPQDEEMDAATKRIKIHTIDMYQGDENDIVIVSLVRSNSTGKIGFLQWMNRRCVAQSRAKCGLYFIGNINTLSRGQSPWSFLIRSLQEEKKVGRQFPFICKVHPEQKLTAVTAEDIPLDGLCKIPCGTMMGCEVHVCRKTCQPFHGHTAADCQEKVTVTLTKCDHKVTKKCCIPIDRIRCKKPCSKLMECKIHHCSQLCHKVHSHRQEFCDVKVDFNFTECGHKGQKECGKSEYRLLCKTLVSFKIEKCGHMGKRKCFQDEGSISCKELCPRLLPCDHPCDKLCGEACNQKDCKECEKLRQVEMKKMRKMERQKISKAKHIAEMKLNALKEEQTPMFVEHILPVGDTASEVLDLEDRLRKYIHPASNWLPQVTRIEKIHNVKLEEAWYEAQIGMVDPTRSELKFLASEDANFQEIIEEGFKMSTPQGGAIYFAANSTKSVHTLNTPGAHKLLLCNVLIGKSKTVDKSTHPNMNEAELHIDKYDSVFWCGANSAGGDRNDEYAIYRHAQALPKYIIHYTPCMYEEDALTKPRPAGPAKFEHHVLKPKRDYDPNDEHDIHFRVAESQFMRLTSHYGSKEKVTSVTFYTNPELGQNFRQKQTEFDLKYNGGPESKMILAFHGTPTDENIENIMKHNFKVGPRALYGKGVYFSEFPQICKTYAQTLRKLILCRILPGRSYTVKMSGQEIQAGYDSHMVKTDNEGRGEMVVIDNLDQILPTYVISYE